MLRDIEISSEGSADWALGHSSDAGPRSSLEKRVLLRNGSDDQNVDWQTIDRALRSIAKRRAALDAEEADWLRKAEAIEIWKQVGAVSMLDYLERLLGYAPRTSQDRLRVARALGTLPQLTAALAGGDLSFSAVRELSRVATPTTEAEWRDAAIGKNALQVHELVADHRPGDLPGDPPVPELRSRAVRFDLLPDIFALLRQVRTMLDEEHGRHLDDNEFIAALCGASLDGGSTSEPTGRARFQVAVTLCERCRQGWQDGGGVRVAIGADAVERALCDAQHIGSVDGHVAERAYQDIPPSIARMIWHRDGGRCRVPGCRSARNLELHHITHRAEGGTHDAKNITLLCGSCHRAHHAGLLMISGTADHLEVRKASEPCAPMLPRSQEARAHIDTNASAPHEEANSRGPAMSGPALHPSHEAGAHVNTSADRCVELEPPRSPDPGHRPNATGDEAGKGSGRHDTSRPALHPNHEAGAHVSTSADRRVAIAPPRSPSPHEVNAHGPDILLRGQEADAHVSTNADRRFVVDPLHPGDRLSAAVRREEVKSALLGLGWKPAVVRTALAEAAAALEADATFDQLLREALRRCPRPSTMI